MYYKVRKFIGKDSFKAVAWDSKMYTASKFFEDKSPYTWHTFDITSGSSYIELDVKEAEVVMKELIHFLAAAKRTEDKLRALPKTKKKAKK
jgi:hypothetical protein